MDFKPGQFVQIGYSSDGSKIDVQRPYSIGSAPRSDVMDFYIEMINGKLTSVLDKASVGEIYNLGASNGKNFEYSLSQNKKIVVHSGCDRHRTIHIHVKIHRTKSDTRGHSGFIHRRDKS